MRLRNLPVKLDLRFSLVLLLAGCQAAPLADTSVAEVQLLGRNFFHATPRVTASVPQDGMAHTQVNLTVEDASLAPHFSVLALPTTFWSKALISLYSSTVNTSYDPAIHSQTLNSFTTSSTPVASLLGPATPAGPGVVAVDRAGNPYVSNGSAIVKYAGGASVAFGPAVNVACGMAFDAAGNLYVSESGAKVITKVASNGTATTFSNSGLLTDPRGLAFDVNGVLHVSNLDGSIVKITTAGVASSFVTGLVTPIHLAFDAQGNLYATSNGGSQIGKVTPAGVVTPAWFSQASLSPGGIVFSNGALLVSRSTGSADLLAINPATATSTVFKAGAFTDPVTPSAGPYAYDLAVAGNGTLYAAEQSQNKLWKVVPDTHYSASATFQPLRPAADYTAQVFLQNPAGGNMTLSASQTLTSVSLATGGNVLDFLVKVNGNEMSYQLSSSNNNNVVTGNAIVKDDKVTLATGIDASQPGIDHLVLELSGAAYANTTCTLAVLPLSGAATWNSFTWDTTLAATLPGGYVGAAAYNPTTLSGGTGLASIGGNLVIKTYDVRNNLVGNSTITLAVYGKPTVSLDLH
ncbi:MAG: two component regulator propeller family protein [Cyanobacteria bacterium RYN_339]|nr:two component regulator propeller family protein [Cyanobacteria bacterium RYN_339]